MLVFILSFSMLTTNVFADVNLGNADGTGFQSGTSNNYWGLHTDSGVHLNETEGLRVTVYDAEKNTKVFNTIDITGNANIVATSDIQYFSDGSEFIAKTTWLNYVGSIYNSISESDMTKFNNTVLNKSQMGGYQAQYIPQLSSIDIISIDNTSHLNEIKSLLSDEFFLMNLCDLIGNGLTYDDILDGKYKIAFEPVAYFRYNGQNWAMSATECGLLNKYMKNYFTAEWNSTNNLRALLGPLTHSNLPRSAFLENRDLGISVYSPTSGDYYNGNSSYNSDTCIIRCMGIGVLTGNASDDTYEEFTGSISVAEYHTDTNVYTSFYVKNTGEDAFIGDTTFSVKDSDDKLVKKKTILDEKYKELYQISRNQYGPPDFYYGYTEEKWVVDYCDENDKIQVFVDNPKYVPDEDGNYPYIPQYKLLGTYKNGDTIDIGSDYKALVSYTVKTKSGTIITSGNVNINCPADEESMGWFEWHTPTRAQDITIFLRSNNTSLMLLDSDGNECQAITINAAISKVEEKTPPDPKVTDTRPAWLKIYSMSSVQEKISEYATDELSDTLSWYTWSYSSSWKQHQTSVPTRYVLITGGMTHDDPNYPYLNSEHESVKTSYTSYGVNNKYYASETAKKESGKFYQGAVYISTADIQLEKVEYSISVSADVKISPSDHCKTALYSESNQKYTMKSGYGIQINVDTHISGDTEYCTGSQTANVLFPEFNYNRHETTLYNRLLEKVNGEFVFKKNEYSTYNDRVHFTPIWFPDRKNYTVYVEVFDVWCPAGQLSVRVTDQIYIKGNVYDDWHVAPVKP